MKVTPEVSQASRKEEYMRSGARVNSRVKVRLEWEDGGRSQGVEGYTVDVSPKGCMAIVPHGFGVGQGLSVKNLINGKESAATVIWKGHEGRTGWEVGLELKGAPGEFWEVEF